MNPYASFLDGQDPVSVAAATSARLARLLKTAGADRLNVSLSPGKWSMREILCHLADTEIAFAFRLRQGLAEDRHVIQPFDQDQWSRRYASVDAHAALAAFTALRQWNLILIQSLSPADLARPMSHPERGEMTLRTVVETMGGHDLNHLRQLAAIAERPAA